MSKMKPEMKHEVFREILGALGLEEKDEYFSTGGTVTTNAFRVVRDELLHRQGIIHMAKVHVDDYFKRFLNRS